MFFSTAYSSAGQFRKDGSTTLTRPSDVAPSASTQCQRLGHVARHRARHEQAIGVTRRGDEVNAEPFEIVVRPGEPRDLELAAVAGAGVDLADRERASEEPRDLPGEALADPLDLSASSHGLGDDARVERGPKLTEHRSAPRRPARLLTKLAEHRLGSRQLVVEDPPRHVEEVADECVAHRVPDRRALLSGRHDILGAQDGELLRHGGLVEVEAGLKLLDATLVRAKDLEDPDAERVRQRLEELDLEGLKSRRRRRAHENYCINIY